MLFPLGRGLIVRLGEVAISQGHHVMVAAISGSNMGAVKFHERLGFQQVAHMREVGQKNGVWLDLLLMQKILDKPTDTFRNTG